MNGSRRQEGLILLDDGGCMSVESCDSTGGIWLGTKASKDASWRFMASSRCCIIEKKNRHCCILLQCKLFVAMYYANPK